MLNENSDQYERRWSLLEEHLRTGKPIAGRIIEVVRGRMQVDVQGIQTSLENFTIGFTYQITPELKAENEQLSVEEFRESRTKEACERMRGQEMLFRVIAVDPTPHVLKLSQKLYTDEEMRAREQRREELLRELQPGDVCIGMVRLISGNRIVRVDLGGIDGIIFPHHLFEPWRPFSEVDAREVVQLGQEIEVMVLDNQKQHFSLSLVHVVARDKMLAELRPGSICEGRIVCLTDQGVYIDIGGPIGKIPNEQLLSGYITHPADLYHRNQKMRVRVEEIMDDKRIMLSLIKAEQ